MLEENEKYNLTAITDTDKIILNHYADCCMLSARLKKNASIIDVGCGAGFPSLPLAIVRPDLKILAVDSTAKRVAYVSESAALLGLDNLTALAMRAEDGGKSPEYREKFDYATARAVAEMRVLCELTMPFVKVGGQLLAMKGKNAEFELSGAKKAIATLGGRKTTCESVSVKGGDEVLTHPIIIIDKKEKTPQNYPRPFAQISKKPL
jgi:16S rRNA (guanine(527)-N(7))-methyltransferase RsmG